MNGKTPRDREIISLPLAIRVFPDPQQTDKKKQQTPWKPPQFMLVFDTETRIDAAQRLTFGSYRYYEFNNCIEEGLFYGDDLPNADRTILEDYVRSHAADVSPDCEKRLRFLTRNQFANKIFHYGCRYHAWIIGFNLPFDLSRIAAGFANARLKYAGGFSLILNTRRHPDTGTEIPNDYRPRVVIKQIDNKRALKGFTAYKSDEADKKVSKFSGHFLDLKTLAFALNNEPYSLESACRDFGVEHGKQKVERHGIVTPEYIDYNRRDVLATAELAVKLLEEYSKHPISLQPTRAFSPASIGKAYLRVMGIQPILERQPDFPKEYLGFAQTAFFGGRASAHIRKIPVPVVHTDFLSMYPTVNSLMGLWRYVISEKIKVVEHCQDEIVRFLESITPDDLFKPSTWEKLSAFVRIIPDGDILPTRGRYNDAAHDWQVAVNYLYAENNVSDPGLWYSLPDAIASVILTNGKIPRIIDAFRLEPVGISAGIQPTKLRNEVKVNPKGEDFFKAVIEERKRAKKRNLPEKEKSRLDKALKVLANSTSYGIYAETNRHESDERSHVICYGTKPEPITCSVQHPEQPGEFCFPPLAALITGAARLMLSLLEHSVTERGGTYAMEDTDSMWSAPVLPTTHN